MPIPQVVKDTYYFYFDKYAREDCVDLWNWFLEFHQPLFNFRKFLYLILNVSVPDEYFYKKMFIHVFIIDIFNFILVIPYLYFWVCVYIYRKRFFFIIWWIARKYKRWYKYRGVIREIKKKKVIYKKRHLFILKYIFNNRFNLNFRNKK